MKAEPPKADPPKRKRRRFQFRLRTLVVGVTLLAVVCAYVAHQARIVRDRQAWVVAQREKELEFQKAWFEALNKKGVEFPHYRGKGKRIDTGVELLELPETARKLTDGRGTGGPSFIRRWLGDVRYDQIAVIAPDNDDECRKAVELFPESLVIVVEHHR